MFEISEFITLTIVATLMVVSPGPDFAVVLKNSLVSGRVAGMYASFGIVFANLVHVMLNLFGIGLLISQSVTAFSILKILGASYLIYIGCRGLLSKAKIDHKNLHAFSTVKDSEQIIENAKANLKHIGFVNGFTTSILNPKACLFYLSLFSVLLSPDTQFATRMGYGIWVCCIALLWFSLVSFFFTTPIIGKKLQSMKHKIERITGGVLIALGLKLLVDL
jgi:RhtB (resistance to homoserine/threonine) family protein